MDHQQRIVIHLAGWLLVVSSGCASWSKDMLPKAMPFQSAAKEQPTFESTLSLARLSERHGEPGQAELVYQAVLRKDPNNKTAHHRLAVLAIKQQKFDDAESHFQSALGDNPDSNLLTDWGYYLYLVDRLPESEAVLRKALQLDNGNARAHNNLGLVLGSTDRLEESLAEFRFGGDEASARANLAYVHSLNGDFEESKAEYHQALQLDSHLKPAAEALLALHARNDAKTAAKLAYDPKLPMRSDVAATNEAQPDNASQLSDTAQVATVSHAAHENASQMSATDAGGVQQIGDAANFHLNDQVISADYSEPASGSTSPVQQATQALPAAKQQALPAANQQALPAAANTAPPSLQSLPPQPWQVPTWTAK